jgi:hypothetical protein
MNFPGHFYPGEVGDQSISRVGSGALFTTLETDAIKVCIFGSEGFVDFTAMIGMPQCI